MPMNVLRIWVLVGQVRRVRKVVVSFFCCAHQRSLTSNSKLITEMMLRKQMNVHHKPTELRTAD